ncbi:hypothetical protein [Paractinoplanes brasiliensis]|uniref:Uncharacterized protein n=1 Tax=Paractinoplanes brasiliensis TaxID=52695 RepID=A0A4R6JSG9_9ACTN|nr:hypothetical protein [Actinoplanes brasiliensis]TDO39429.1 hypothetical protein C8E87_3117 [Actinoplanes brasiliensis]GID32719.1 hypothetical protein Abr02nite_77020 [Actinoplanes brasiliensis]
MNIVADLILAGALVAVWLTAGLLADSLSSAPSAPALRRRAGLITLLIAAGATVFVAITIVTALMPGESAAPAAALAPAVPALIVLTAGLRRVAQVRRGAGAFATAPQTPVPPALRAAAAHPLILVPLQVTGLATLLSVPIAGGLVEVPGADLAGIAITVVGVAVLAIGIRAGLRHSRLSVLALAPIGRNRPRVPVDSR